MLNFGQLDFFVLYDLSEGLNEFLVMVKIFPRSFGVVESFILVGLGLEKAILFFLMKLEKVFSKRGVFVIGTA
jgi:hypothetical protein